jgi:ubiquinol-cytochrome c reductase iron-sulfur subunit
MLRRSAQSILPRLGGSLAGSLQSTSLKDGVSCIATSLNETSSFDNGRIPSPFKLDFSRSFASDVVTGNSQGSVTLGNIDGLTPTVHAIKNPTPNIEYDSSNHDRFPPGDTSKRAFTYMVLTGGRFIYASAIRLAVLKFILSMTASKDVLALANLEVELGSIAKGQTVTVKWRGKPVFIRHRTDEDIKLAEEVDVGSLRDPETDEVRVKDKDWLIVVGVCTHLGCVPLPNAGDYHGWFCPCHGSHYDTSGRIRKGPAPYNLEVPSYSFMEDNKVLIG